MLKRFRMEECAVVSTPMITSYKLHKDYDSPTIDATLYRSMIGGLLYLTTSRLDIMQVVGMVIRFQLAPQESHMQVVKGYLDI